MKKLVTSICIALAAIMVSACGKMVEVSPTEVGRIMTKDGYQDKTITTSKFRLDWCWLYCDKLVKIDISDSVQTETMKIFMPKDKLNIETLTVRGTLSINPNRIDALFTKVPAVEGKDGSYHIGKETIYKTYAENLIQSTVREYLTNFTIAEVSSSLETINIDLFNLVSERLKERTPFTLRSFGIVNIRYPDIITKAQENAAQRREQIQQEEAQLEISKVSLQRELQEARLKRQIEIEKAETEAASQKIQREVVDSRVLELRRLENERMWIEKWDGKVPHVNGSNGMLLNVGVK